jgi:RNA polymerase sigma-70 factor, ECF subfamily
VSPSTNSPAPDDAALFAEASEETDVDLVRLAQNGDRHAFATLVTRYQRRVLGMAYHMVGNESDAADIAQDVFLKAWKALPKFEARSQFYTWIYRIAHNTGLDYLRKRRTHSRTFAFDDAIDHSHEDGATGSLSHDAGPDGALEHRELGERIHAALQTLSPEHRAVVMLKEIEGLSYQEIADSVGCTLGTVMSRLFYARKKLQALLADCYGGQAAGA